MKDGTVLATFTAPKVNELSSPARLSYSSSGAANGTITMTDECINDVTIYANTKLNWAIYENPDSSITLKGDGASFCYGGYALATLAEGSADATISMRNGNLSLTAQMVRNSLTRSQIMSSTARWTSAASLKR